MVLQVGEEEEEATAVGGDDRKQSQRNPSLRLLMPQETTATSLLNQIREENREEIL